MKLKKKSGLIGVVVALSAASLISVGFASWVISQGTTEDVSGTIKVDNVVENNYEIEFVSGGSGSHPYTLTENVVYGYAAFDTSISGLTNNGWLTNDTKLDGTGAANSSLEHLTVSFTFKVKSVNGSNSTYIAPTVNGPAASLTLDDDYGYVLSASAVTCTGYDTTIAEVANVLGALPTPSIEYNASTSVYTCTIEFSWGSHFTVTDSSSATHVVNPMTYYNSQVYGSTIATEAKNVLEGLKTALDNKTFSTTLTIAKA